MRFIARFLIFIMFAASAVLLMVQPIAQWAESGELDAIRLFVHCIFAFALVFAGAEGSEELGRRWRKKGKDADRDH